MNLGSAAGAWLAGLDRDNFGNYHASLIANVIMGVTAAAITMSIRMQPFEARQRERRTATSTAGVAGD
jgi:predicted MFS family arabinose efflux permease